MTRGSSLPPPPHTHTPVTLLRYKTELQERSAGTPRGRVAFRGEISPWMAGEPGFIPWLLGSRGGIESQLLKGRMTLKTEFTVIWFLHYISIIFPAAQGVAARLKSKHDCKLDAGRSELNGECVSARFEKSKRASGDYVLENSELIIRTSFGTGLLSHAERS